jgi:multidrug transporter EmrE-like cation transporter
MSTTNTVNLLSLCVCTTALAIGQLLFKHVGLKIRGLDASAAAHTLAAQPAFYAALVLYGAATLLWIWILARVSLMQAYAWMVGAGVIIVPLLGWYIFGERVAPPFWIGAALIAGGIVLTQYFGQIG